MRENFGMSIVDVCRVENERLVLTDMVLYDELRALLIRLGVTPRLLGFDYLIYAIQLSVAYRDFPMNVTTRLYPAVAQRFGVDPMVVERNIRHAIGIVIIRDKLAGLNAYLGTDAFSRFDRPTNAEFISLIADKIIADRIRSGVRWAQGNR